MIKEELLRTSVKGGFAYTFNTQGKSTFDKCLIDELYIMGYEFRK